MVLICLSWRQPNRSGTNFGFFVGSKTHHIHWVTQWWTHRLTQWLANLPFLASKNTSKNCGWRWSLKWSENSDNEGDDVVMQDMAIIILLRYVILAANKYLCSSVKFIPSSNQAWLAVKSNIHGHWRMVKIICKWLIFHCHYQRVELNTWGDQRVARSWRRRECQWYHLKTEFGCVYIQ